MSIRSDTASGSCSSSNLSGLASKTRSSNVDFSFLYTSSPRKFLKTRWSIRRLIDEERAPTASIRRAVRKHHPYQRAKLRHQMAASSSGSPDGQFAQVSSYLCPSSPPLPAVQPLSSHEPIQSVVIDLDEDEEEEEEAVTVTVTSDKPKRGGPTVGTDDLGELMAKLVIGQKDSKGKTMESRMEHLAKLVQHLKVENKATVPESKQSPDNTGDPNNLLFTSGSKQSSGGSDADQTDIVLAALLDKLSIEGGKEGSRTQKNKGTGKVQSHAGDNDSHMSDLSSKEDKGKGEAIPPEFADVDYSMSDLSGSKEKEKGTAVQYEVLDTDFPMSVSVSVSISGNMSPGTETSAPAPAIMSVHSSQPSQEDTFMSGLPAAATLPVVPHDELLPVVHYTGDASVDSSSSSKGYARWKRRNQRKASVIRLPRPIVVKQTMPTPAATCQTFVDIPTCPEPVGPQDLHLVSGGIPWKDIPIMVVPEAVPEIPAMSLDPQEDTSDWFSVDFAGLNTVAQCKPDRTSSILEPTPLSTHPSSAPSPPTLSSVPCASPTSPSSTASYPTSSPTSPTYSPPTSPPPTPTSPPTPSPPTPSPPTSSPPASSPPTSSTSSSPSRSPPPPASSSPSTTPSLIPDFPKPSSPTPLPEASFPPVPELPCSSVPSASLSSSLVAKLGDLRRLKKGVGIHPYKGISRRDLRQVRATTPRVAKQRGGRKLIEGIDTFLLACSSGDTNGPGSPSRFSGATSTCASSPQSASSTLVVTSEPEGSLRERKRKLDDIEEGGVEDRPTKRARIEAPFSLSDASTLVTTPELASSRKSLRRRLEIEEASAGYPPAKRQRRHASSLFKSSTVAVTADTQAERPARGVKRKRELEENPVENLDPKRTRNVVEGISKPPTPSPMGSISGRSRSFACDEHSAKAMLINRSPYLSNADALRSIQYCMREPPSAPPTPDQLLAERTVGFLFKRFLISLWE